MFWDFFYSFVSDTSLEMCLNGNVLLWNLRDTCFLVISLFFLKKQKKFFCCCAFICWVVLLHPLGWVHLPWRVVVAGGIMLNPGEGWDWSLFSRQVLKIALKRIYHHSSLAQVNHVRSPQFMPPQVWPERLSPTRWNTVFEAVDCGGVVLRLHIFVFFLFPLLCPVWWKWIYHGTCT